MMKRDEEVRLADNTCEAGEQSGTHHAAEAGGGKAAGKREMRGTAKARVRTRAGKPFTRRRTAYVELSQEQKGEATAP